MNRSRLLSVETARNVKRAEVIAMAAQKAPALFAGWGVGAQQGRRRKLKINHKTTLREGCFMVRRALVLLPSQGNNAKTKRAYHEH